MSTSKRDESSSSSKPTVAIVGAGPAGLFAALGAARKGYRVELIYKHPPGQGARRQRVYLGSDSISLLNSYIDSHDEKDKKFIEKLKKQKHVSLNNLEVFLYRKLNNLKKTHPDIHDTHGEVENVDINDHVLNIKQNDGTPKNIPYYHLIDASGSARVVFNKINALDEKKDEDSRSRLSYQPVHNAQGTAIFHLALDKRKKHVDKSFYKNVYTLSFNASDMNVLKDEFKWDHDYPPNIYFIPYKSKSGKYDRFYVAGDIPSHILKDLKQAKSRGDIKAENECRERCHNWFRFMVEKQAKIPQDDLVLKSKLEEKKELKGETRKLEVTIFEINLFRTKMPFRVISKSKNPQVLAAIGDALQDPHFHAAHGTSDALKSGDKLVKCLPDLALTKELGTFNVEEFADFLHEQNLVHQNRLLKMWSQRISVISDQSIISAMVETEIIKKEKEIVLKSIHPETGTESKTTYGISDGSQLEVELKKLYIIKDLIDNWKNGTDINLDLYALKMLALKNVDKKEKTEKLSGSSSILSKLKETHTDSLMEEKSSLWLKLSLCHVSLKYHELQSKPMMGLMKRTHDDKIESLLKEMINPNKDFKALANDVKKTYQEMLMNWKVDIDKISASKLTTEIRSKLTDKTKHHFFRIMTALLHEIYTVEKQLYPDQPDDKLKANLDTIRNELGHANHYGLRAPVLGAEVDKKDVMSETASPTSLSLTPSSPSHGKTLSDELSSIAPTETSSSTSSSVLLSGSKTDDTKKHSSTP